MFILQKRAANPPMPVISNIAFELSSLAEELEPSAGSLEVHARRTSELLLGLDLRAFFRKEFGPKLAELFSQETAASLHIGFLAPHGCSVELLKTVAKKANFTSTVSCFESEILAHEFAELTPQDRIPTTVVKAFDCSNPRLSVGWEAFLPNAPADFWGYWKDGRVDRHLGIGLRTNVAVSIAQQLCRDAGFYPPTFLGEDFGVNRTEDIVLRYADGFIEGAPLRLEFCYHADE